MTNKTNIGELLHKLGDLTVHFPKCAGILPNGQIDPAINDIEKIRSELMACLSGVPGVVQEEDLKACVSLKDVPYWVQCYYPPAALDEAQHLTISFEDVRRLARKALE